MRAAPPVRLLAVVGLLVAGVAVGSLPRRADPAAAPAASQVDVVGATAVCPDLRQAGDRLTTRVSVGVAPGGGQAAAGGRVEARALTAAGAPTAVPVERPGQVAVGLGSAVDGDALVVTARGPLAAGLELEQVTRGESGSTRGLAGLRCAPARTQAWFVGGSTVVGDAALLVLVNPDPTPAQVDVTVFTAAGPAEARPGRGIVVPARSRVAVPLERLAPDRDLLAVHVDAERGRFAAAVRHARFDGRVPRGVEWVPESPPPAREVVLAGVPAGPGRRTVLVTNPGPDATSVSLQLTGARGQQVPAALAAVPVPAGTTVAVPVTDLTATQPVAVRVTSDGGPVLASAFVYDAQDGPVREFAYAGAGGPLTGPALVTDLVIDQPTESTLLLSALQDGGAVTVTPVPIVGRFDVLPPARTVQVPAHRTTALALSTFLPPGATGRLAVEVRPLPGSGPVWAGRYLRERAASGPLTTILRLQGAAQRVERPAVQRDPGLGATR